MSKYLMNKLIHQVNMNQAMEDDYTSNPRAFVDKVGEESEAEVYALINARHWQQKTMARSTLWARTRSRSGALLKPYGFMTNRGKSSSPTTRPRRPKPGIRILKPERLRRNWVFSILISPQRNEDQKFNGFDLETFRVLRELRGAAV